MPSSFEEAFAEELARLPGDAKDAATVRQGLSPDALSRAQTDIFDRFDDPEVQLKLNRQLKALRSKSKSAGRSLNKLTSAAELSGDERLIEQTRRQTDPDSISDRLLDAGKSGVDTALRVLDEPSRWVRQAVADTDDPAEYIKYIRENYPSLAGIADVVGTPLNIPVAGLTAGVGAAGALLSGEGLSGASDTASRLYEMQRNNPEAGGDFFMHMVSDPLTLVGYGATAPTKVMAKQMARVLRGSNKAKALSASTDIVGQATAILKRHGNTPKFLPEMEALALRHGLDKDLMREVMGEGLGRAGRAGLEVGIPFGPKAEILSQGRLDPLLQRGERFARGLNQKVGGIDPDPGLLSRQAKGDLDLDSVGGRLALAAPEARSGANAFGEIDPHAARGATRRIKSSRAMARQNALTELRAFDKAVKEAGANITADRQKWLLHNVLDPDYDTRSLDGPTLAGQSPYENPNIVYMKDGQPVSPETLGGDWFEIKPKHGAQHPRDVIPTLPENEQKYVQLLGEHFNRQKRRLVEADLLPDNGGYGNLLSGYYVPRRYEVDKSLPNHLRRRGEFGGRSLGKNAEDPEGFVATDNLDELVTKYQPAIERKLSEAYFDRWVADKLGDFAHGGKGMRPLRDTSGVTRSVPEDVHTQLKSHFNEVWKPQTNTIVDKFMTVFKSNVLMGVPRYHLVNMFGDSMLMAANGFRNPKMFALSKKLWSKNTAPDTKMLIDPHGHAWTKGEIVSHLEKSNIGQQAGHFDVDLDSDVLKRSSRIEARGGGKAEQIKANFQDQSKITAVGAGISDVSSLGLNRAGRAAAQTWDQHAKTSFFLDRLSKGDSLNAATDATFEVLFDYSDQDKLLQMLRKSVPFATWQYKALKAVPRTIIKKPASAQIVPRFAETFGEQDPLYQDETPRFQSERGITMNLAAPQREAFRKLNTGIQTAASKVTGAEVQELDPGFGLNLRARDPMSEALAPALELFTRGNPDPLFQMLDPIKRGLLEFAIERDLFQKRDMSRPNLRKDDYSLFNYGDPLALELEGLLGMPQGSLQARNGQMSILSRNLPQFIVPPIATWLANEVARGKGAPGTVYGASRPFSDQAGSKAGSQGIGLLTGGAVSTTTPNTGLLNTGYGQPAKNLNSLQRTLKQATQRAGRPLKQQ